MAHEKRYSDDIDHLRNPERIQRLEVERVVDLCLEGIKPSNILDIGVGSGLFAEAFARRGLAVAGIDASQEMVAVAREFVPQGDFRQAEAESLPWADQSFDLVFMGLVLHEADDPRRALQEARRVARQRVCILEWPYQEEEHGAPLAHRLAPQDLEKMFLRAGYAKRETIPLTHMVFYKLGV